MLASRLLWPQVEAALAPYFARQARAGRVRHVAVFQRRDLLRATPALRRHADRALPLGLGEAGVEERLIGKGKARKRYEFGVKVSVAVTSPSPIGLRA